MVIQIHISFLFYIFQKSITCIQYIIFKFSCIDIDLKSEIEKSLDLPAIYSTVVRRAQLAQQIHELGKDELKNCDKLVHEQHLQHQGWMAVIANLEDITEAFQERCSEFDKVFRDHIERRMEYKDYLGR